MKYTICEHLLVGMCTMQAYHAGVVSMHILSVGLFYLVAIIGNIYCNQATSGVLQYPCTILEQCDIIRTLVENQNSTAAQNIIQGLGSK